MMQPTQKWGVASVLGSLGFLIVAACGTPSGTTGPATGDDDDDDNFTPPPGCESLVAEGYALGNVAQNWELVDRNNEPVHLWDYCGRVIFFEEGSEW